MMLTSKFFWCFCSLILMFTTGIYGLNYDHSDCTSSATQVSNFSYYHCTNNSNPSCQAFIVYRAQQGYDTLATIAALFSSGIDTIHSFNNLSKVYMNPLPDGYEIIIPTTCSCPQECAFCRAIYAYNASQSDSSSAAVACEIFQGLATAQNLKAFNPDFVGGNQASSSMLQVPLKCACPDSSDTQIGIAHFATYPILEHDTPGLIGLKFNTSAGTIRGANGLNPFDAIFPRTTLFIPLTRQPYLNPELVPTRSDNQSQPENLIPSRSTTEPRSLKYLRSFGAIAFTVIIFIVIMYAATSFICNKNAREVVESSSAARPPSPSNFSQDFLDGMTKLKHSFTYFSLEELTVATGNFNEGSVIGPGVYRGKFGESNVAIKQMSSREVANNIICILTKINHLNVVKLEGYYDGRWPYLVFELAENGSLRDCLSKPRIVKELTWSRRIQIAFDIAEGLHYLHYSTKPTYVHRNINTQNILITADWRAKISGFGSAIPLLNDDQNEEKGEQVSTKVDVNAFGAVVVELLSAKEAAKNGHILDNYLSSAAEKELHQDPSSSSSYLESLEQFIDPALEKGYPVDHVLFLACLAKCCMEENRLKRVTINDVLMALSKIL